MMIDDNDLLMEEYSSIGGVPKYLKTWRQWAVKTEHGIEIGAVDYVVCEFCGASVIFHYNNSEFPDPLHPNHAHSFQEVLGAVIDDPVNFSLVNWSSEYSMQEIAVIQKLQEKLMEVKGKYKTWGHTRNHDDGEVELDCF